MIELEGQILANHRKGIDTVQVELAQQTKELVGIGHGEPALAQLFGACRHAHGLRRPGR